MPDHPSPAPHSLLLKTWARRSLPYALLIAAILCSYSNALRGPFVFDDESSITDNPTLRSARTALFPPSDSGLTVSGRPLLNLSLAINYAISAKSVLGYHVTNIAIHITAALILFALVRRTLHTSALVSKFSAHATPLALCIAALWALHPLQTESVTYIVQRAESLVGLFYLLTLYGLTRAAAATTTSANIRWQLVTVAACAAGMASKEVMASAPLCVLLFDRAFFAGSFSSAWKTRRTLYLSLAATWFILFACILSTGNRGGTAGFGVAMSPWRYLLTQCEAITHYLQLVVWPSPLILDHGTRLVSSLSEVIWPASALVLLFSATLYALWKYPRIGFLGTAFFAILSPTSSFVPVASQTIAEHRMYLPLAPIIVGLALAGYALARRWAFILYAAAALALACTTYQRNFDYQNELTLWTDTRDKAPDNIRAWRAVANILCRLDRLDEARIATQHALAMDPEDPSSLASEGNLLFKANRTPDAILAYQRALAAGLRTFELHYNLGKCLLDVGRIPEAIAHLETAIRLVSVSSDAHYNLGNAYLRSQRPAQSLTYYETAITLDPASIDAHNNLAKALSQLDRADEALTHYQAALALDPNSADTHLNLGQALCLRGQSALGREHFQTALRLRPHFAEAHANLAASFLSQNDTSAARTHYEAALADGLDQPRIRLGLSQTLQQLGEPKLALPHLLRATEQAPDSAPAHHALADALLQDGQLPAAIAHYESALRLSPDSPECHNNLGIALAQLGRIREAKTHFAQAVRLRPDFREAQENLAHAEAALR